MPCWLVVATLTFPPGPLAVTLAPGTTAPEGSVTWPRTVPVPIWPQAAAVMIKINNATHPNRDELIGFSPEIQDLLVTDLLPPCRGSSYQEPCPLYPWSRSWGGVPRPIEARALEACRPGLR